MMQIKAEDTNEFKSRRNDVITEWHLFAYTYFCLLVTYYSIRADELIPLLFSHNYDRS